MKCLRRMGGSCQKGPKKMKASPHRSQALMTTQKTIVRMLDMDGGGGHGFTQVEGSVHV